MSLINEKRICEYFLISGFGEHRKPYDLSQIYNQGEEIFNANVEITKDFFHYKEPIVDIQIVDNLSPDKLPEGYHVVDRTYSKLHKADLNGKASVDELYLCFRLGRDLPPITDIWAIHTRQHKSPPGQLSATNSGKWTLIDRTSSGHSANLGSSSNPLYIGFKRAPESAPVDHLAVTDVCIILANKNELCPPAYSRVDVPIRRSPLGHTINICYKKSTVKEHVLSFQPDIIYCLPCTSTTPIVDAYNPDPSLVRSQACLPDDICDVANFCMPWGATIELCPPHRSLPKPSFLQFVLTNIYYNRMYGAAVLFYEEMTEEELSEDEIINLGLNDKSKAPDNTKIFCNKSLCFLSRWPLFQTFNQVISFLIEEDKRQRITPSLNYIPIERYISQFLHTVAFPTPQAPNILLQWDLENAIGIQLPTDGLSKFGTGENFYHLVRMLDVEQIIQLFVYMLTEQKILLTSTCNSDLIGIAEALIAMIFPFKWSVVYIPFLYLRCIHIIQSPSPYLIGVDSRFFDFFRLPEGVGCIDLITKSIKPPDPNCKYLDYVKVLPKSVLKSLRNGLSNCKTKVTSFERQQNIRNTTGNVMDEFTILRRRESIGESIRECFLRAVILMFKNYQSNLIPLSFRQKHNDMFHIEGFLKSVDRNSRILYQAIFDTQLWSNFILERSYATEFDDNLAFFDRCIKFMRDMDDETVNATSLLQTDSVIKSEHTKVLPPPDPIVGSLPIPPRNTFPRRFCSDFMLPSIHITQNTNDDEVGNGDSVVDLNYLTPVTMNNEKRNEYGSSASLTTDSCIPVLQIKPESSVNNSSNTRNRRSNKVTMLKRSIEEMKQARLLGKEAKSGQCYEWAGHLLCSSYCLWFLSLPGLIGLVEETPELKETGLTERILQLASQLLDSIRCNRLSLPDEVCYRVMFILIHQLRPPRLNIAELLRHGELSAFSYGLSNQILLEQEQKYYQKTINTSDFETPNKDEPAQSILLEESVPSKDEIKDEKDCDSGRATLASTTVAPEEAQDSSDSGCNFHSKEGNRSIEIGGKSVQLRGKHQTPRSGKDRISQLIINSPLEFCSNDLERSHQFFDPKAGIIMSATTRPVTPILPMFRSPGLRLPETAEEISTPQLISNVQTNSIKPAIIARSIFSEERSELHVSYLSKKRSSLESNSNSDDRVPSSQSVNNPESNRQENDSKSNDSMDLSKSRMSDSRLTQSEFSSDKVANKTRASFRQFKNAANKSLRSMRNIMTSVGSASWLTPPDNKTSQESTNKPLPSGLPTAFRPWQQSSNNNGLSGMNSENRLKTTASADLLDTIGDSQESVHISRNCANTVQQMRRHNKFTGVHWPNSESCESFTSDQRFEHESSTTSLDTEPTYVFTDKVYDEITGALAAIRLPTGKYWLEDEVDHDSPTQSFECCQSIQISMTTCTECTVCRQTIYDDDIMSGWSYDDSDLQSLCPYCCLPPENKRNRFTPKLSFQVYIFSQDTENKKQNSNTKSSLAYSSNVNYLSPFVLRKELESVIQQEGESAFLKYDFLPNHGILYWNLVWYYSRLGLPTHLLSFLTIWLRTKAESLASSKTEESSKYQGLLTLTGFEQVMVWDFWEFNQFHKQMALPLYRKYYRDPKIIGNIIVSPNSPSRVSIDAIRTKIVNNDLLGAMSLMMELRIFNRQQVNFTNSQPPQLVERSIYRELFFLLTVAFGTNIDFDAFHAYYSENWQAICKRYPTLVKPYDGPPSLHTLFCRKFFRPLQLTQF